MSDASLARHFIKQYKIGVPDERLSHLETQGQLPYVWEQAKMMKLIAVDTSLEQFRRFLYVNRMNLHLVSTYVPHVYPHHITLFRAHETLQEKGANDLEDSTDTSAHWSPT